MNVKKIIVAIILSGLVYLLVSQVLGMVTQLILPYDWQTIGGMRSINDPIIMAMFLQGFVASIGAVLLYQFMNLKGSTMQKGVKFGALMWIATSLPSAFIIYTTMLYPAGFFLDSVVFGFVNWVLMGASIAWVFEKKK